MKEFSGNIALTKCDKEGVPLFIQSVIPEGCFTGFYNVRFFNGAYGLLNISKLLPKFTIIKQEGLSIGASFMNSVNNHVEQQRIMMSIFTADAKGAF